MPRLDETLVLPRPARAIYFGQALRKHACVRLAEGRRDSHRETRGAFFAYHIFAF